MNEKAMRQLLFTERFQQIYHYLGVFSYLYFLRPEEGIRQDDFPEKMLPGPADGEDIVGFLTREGLLTSQEELLHLNTSLFFNLSVWDLLVRVEPWMRKAPVDTEPSCLTDSQANKAIKDFAQTYALSDFYMHAIR